MANDKKRLSNSRRNFLLNAGRLTTGLLIGGASSFIGHRSEAFFNATLLTSKRRTNNPFLPFNFGAPLLCLKGSTARLAYWAASGALLSVSDPLPGVSTTNEYACLHRHGNFCFFFSQGNIYSYNLLTGTVTIDNRASGLNDTSDNGPTVLRYAANKVLIYSPSTSQYMCLALNLDGTLTTLQTPHVIPGIASNLEAQFHAALTLYDRSSAGLTNFGSKMFGTVATGVGYNSSLLSWTLAGDTLSAGPTTVVNETNYSRNDSVNLTSNLGLFNLFDDDKTGTMNAAGTFTNITYNESYGVYQFGDWASGVFWIRTGLVGTTKKVALLGINADATDFTNGVRVGVYDPTSNAMTVGYVLPIVNVNNASYTENEQINILPVNDSGGFCCIYGGVNDDYTNGRIAMFDSGANILQWCTLQRFSEFNDSMATNIFRSSSEHEIYLPTTQLT